jgi:hypothetical protein
MLALGVQTVYIDRQIGSQYNYRDMLFFNSHPFRASYRTLVCVSSSFTLLTYGNSHAPGQDSYD